MAALLWLLIPLAGAVLASVWGGMAARRRTLVPDAVGVAAYDRFRRAMEAAVPASGGANAADTSLGTLPAADPRAPTAADALAATDGPAREAR
ncbi:hypothetical protein [Streptomyces oceani]|uniref:Uncharacterized protein n=1 Tax=Streptomyces oceani TaxID=1075402 RepID=A0A1E7KPP7_9ACTN|nr:hypothetical protein [Streptomyces oceani]OEV05910.1 hypothetical protein AN216_01160 [Streptomyces oceani]